ncbi:MAG: hypothetical protein K8R54_07825 [Bacteroidales bacterium]|nr:hypothetical protein [Bacteroidales bacterium]
MKKILTVFISSIILLNFIFNFSSCKKDPDDPSFIEQALGWFGEDEDLENIEDDINFGQGDPPASIDLSNHFPPIGDQGQYGTCVAWAVGYNHKSYMDAAAEDRTTFTDNQKFSPKYLFWKIDPSQKGADCNGTGFEPAYDILLGSGITNLATTPYTDLGDCSGSTSSWDGDAADHKIQSYREVEVDITTLKQYLSQGRALSFGAKLGENFMSWNSSSVLYDDTDTYNGQHAYHAMTLCGYDDSRGTAGAFRVVNSWGTSWGDGGYIWVDQNFFVDDFAFCAFAGTNIQTDPDEDGGEDGDVDDPNSGKDLMAWELYDEDYGGGLSRIAKYNAYNVGDEAIPATDDWNMLYIYYNAYDANDYGIMLYDYYSDDYGEYGSDGDLWDEYGVGDGDQNWYNHIDVPAAVSIAHALYGVDPTEDRFQWPYTMPEITGEYYLVLMVDGYDVISEFDESNNYFYLTDANGGPISFVNGIMQENPAKNYTKNMNPQKGDDSPMQSVRTEQNLNTYTTREIRALIMNRLETGDIQRKADLFDKSNSGVKSNN